MSATPRISHHDTANSLPTKLVTLVRQRKAREDGDPAPLTLACPTPLTHTPATRILVQSIGETHKRIMKCPIVTRCMVAIRKFNFDAPKIGWPKSTWGKLFFATRFFHEVRRGTFLCVMQDRLTTVWRVAYLGRSPPATQQWLPPSFLTLQIMLQNHVKRSAADSPRTTDPRGSKPPPSPPKMIRGSWITYPITPPPPLPSKMIHDFPDHPCRHVIQQFVMFQNRNDPPICVEKI